MIAAAIMAEAERIAVSAARNNAAMKKNRKRAAAALDDNHDELPGAAADAAAGPDPGPAALGPAVEMQSGRLWTQLQSRVGLWPLPSESKWVLELHATRLHPPRRKRRQRQLQRSQMKGSEEGVLLGLLTQRFLEVGVVVAEVVGWEATAGRAIEFESL